MSANSILVHCDIIGTSRVNGIEAPVIYNFFLNAAPGDKIVSTLRNLIYAPITLNVISHMLADGSKRERIGSAWRRIDNYVLHKSL